MKKCLLKGLSLGITILKKDNDFYYGYAKLGVIKKSYFHDIENDTWDNLRNDETRSLTKTVKILEPNLGDYLKRINRISNEFISIEEIKELINQTYPDLEFESKEKSKGKMLRK